MKINQNTKEKLFLFSKLDKALQAGEGIPLNRARSRGCARLAWSIERDWHDKCNARSTFETVCMVFWVIKKSKMAKHHPDLIMCRKQPGVGKILFVFNVIVYNQQTDSIMLYFHFQLQVGCAKNVSVFQCFLCDLLSLKF